MPAPLASHLFALNTPAARLSREIDVHYAMNIAAANTSELVDCHKEMMNRQWQIGTANIRALGELANQQEETNMILGSLGQGIDQLADLSASTLDAVYDQASIMSEGFQEIITILTENQKTLNAIADMLARPYEMKMRELLNEANVAIRSGVKVEGKERQAEFEDAMRLLSDVLANPIGSRNYVAWFQNGWLQWQHHNDLPAAQESFFNAMRLSRQNCDLYHSNALRHLAYMHYLQGQLPEAWNTIEKAIAVRPDDYDVLYDAARYAALTGREDAALKMLDKCIDMRPHTIITMFAEGDFIS